MKKILLMFGICLCLLGCTVKNPYKEIDYHTLNQMVKEKKSFVLVIGSNECSHCADYKETMKRVVKKHHVTIYYIDLLSLDEKEIAKLRNRFSFTGTPTTIFVDHGEEKDAQFNRINGAKDYGTIIEKLKKNGYIK